MLVWSEEREPNGAILYPHIVSDTPLGEFNVQYRESSFVVYLDEKWIASNEDLEEAKKMAYLFLCKKCVEIFEFVVGLK